MRRNRVIGVFFWLFFFLVVPNCNVQTVPWLLWHRLTTWLLNPLVMLIFFHRFKNVTLLFHWSVLISPRIPVYFLKNCTWSDDSAWSLHRSLVYDGFRVQVNNSCAWAVMYEPVPHFLFGWPWLIVWCLCSYYQVLRDCGLCSRWAHCPWHTRQNNYCLAQVFMEH